MGVKHRVTSISESNKMPTAESNAEMLKYVAETLDVRMPAEMTDAEREFEGAEWELWNEIRREIIESAISDPSRFPALTVRISALREAAAKAAAAKSNKT